MGGEKFFETARFLGLQCSKRDNDERICTCVECEKKDHLYWNVKKNVGHCHSCGEDFVRPMDLIKSLVEATQYEFTGDRIFQLAKNRSLPVGAFDGYSFGYLNGWYILPVFEGDKRLTSVRRFRLGEPLKWCAGCPSVLFAAHRFSESGRSSEPVYVCEGEWDAIAFEWLRREAKQDGIVVGVPGASTFKPQWHSWFKGRDVTLLYDNDSPGQVGLRTAALALRPIVKSLRVLYWPLDLKAGYDVRDFVVDQLRPSPKKTKGVAS